MNKLQRKILFPTAIYFKDLPNAKELNKYLFKEIKKWRKADPKGEHKTNSGFGWHSKTDMDKRKEYKPLIDELFKMAEECNKDFGVQPKLGLGNMWANINPPGGMNRAHQHPNSLWSGVYWIKTPKNCGQLKIDDPRSVACMTRPRQKDTKKPDRLWRETHYEPIAGRCIMFPSWLMHCVDPNESNDIRISVSFNFLQKGMFV